MARKNNKSQVFVRTFVAGTIALSVISSPSTIMAEELTSLPAIDESNKSVEVSSDKNESLPHSNDVACADDQSHKSAAEAESNANNNEDKANLSDEYAEINLDSKSKHNVSDDTKGKNVSAVSDDFDGSQERKLDAESLNEIVSGFRTFENGTVDLRVFKKNNSLAIGRDTDGDNLNDEDEVVVYEKDGKKYFRYLSDPLRQDSDGDGIIDSVDVNPLKWDLSARDAYLFTKLSYRDKSELDKIFAYDKDEIKQILDVVDKDKDVVDQIDTDLHNKSLIAAQRELARYWRPILTIHEDCGLDAVVFEFRSDIYPYLEQKSNHIIAFRGTESFSDATADIKIYTGVGSNQDKKLREYNQDLINKSGVFSDVDIKNISATGHSLGGYLAQVFLADMQGQKVGDYKTPLHSSDLVQNIYTFNSVPIISRFTSPQYIKDLKDAGDKLNALHKHDPLADNNAAEHRHFVIDGEAVTDGKSYIPGLGGFEHKERLGAIESTEPDDIPGATQAHKLSNFARKQYAPVFNQGIRQGFEESEILPLAVVDGHREDELIGKVKPCSLVVKNLNNEIMFEGFYTLNEFNQEVERTGRYSAVVTPDSAVYTLKAPPTYHIVDADEHAITDWVYTVDKDTQGVFVSDGPAPLFISASIDGVELPSSAFSHQNGSTVIRVNKQTMDSLDNGTHHFLMKYSDGGQATGFFTVEGHKLTSDYSTQTDTDDSLEQALKLALTEAEKAKTQYQIEEKKALKKQADAEKKIQEADAAKDGAVVAKANADAEKAKALEDQSRAHDAEQAAITAKKQMPQRKTQSLQSKQLLLL